jgi:hypothetical protein
MTSTEITFEELVGTIKASYKRRKEIAQELGWPAPDLEITTVQEVMRALPDHIAAADMLAQLASRDIIAYGRNSVSENWYQHCTGLIVAALTEYLAADINSAAA